MRRGLKIGLIAVVLFVALALVVLSAPVQARNAEYCQSKGGFYNYKSMQCFHDGGMENMIGKNIDN
jgi:hypothetical protein